jgi:hypothetical protein
MPHEQRTPATVLDRLGRTVHDGGDADLSPTEQPALIGALEASDRFHRDSGLGNLFHSGKISFRELTVRDSLHIIIEGKRVSAHLDEISPLQRRSDGSIGYSVFRVLAHNVSGACADLARRLRGAHGQQRCNLECEVVWIDDDPAGPRLPGPSDGQGPPD